MAGEAKPAAVSVKNIAPAQPQREELKALERGDATLLELSNNTWRCSIPTGVKPEALNAHPTFWNQLAGEVRDGDEIMGFEAARAWIAKFVVVGTGSNSVCARLVYAVEGAPRLASASSSFPSGYHIERVKAGEPLDGYVVIRESDGLVIKTNGGVPWRTYQDAHEQFPKHAMFRSADVTRYLP